MVDTHLRVSFEKDVGDYRPEQGIGEGNGNYRRCEVDSFSKISSAAHQTENQTGRNVAEGKRPIEAGHTIDTFHCYIGKEAENNPGNWTVDDRTQPRE